MFVNDALHAVIIRRRLRAVEKSQGAVGGISRRFDEHGTRLNRCEDVLRQQAALFGGPRRDEPKDVLVVGCDAHVMDIVASPSLSLTLGAAPIGKQMAAAEASRHQYRSLGSASQSMFSDTHRENAATLKPQAAAIRSALRSTSLL